MKILLINKFLYPNGGSENYIINLGTCLKERGHEVQYFGMEDKRNVVGNSIGSYTSNMDFHAGGGLKKLISPLKLIYSFEARKKIRAVIEDFRPDIAHLNNINFQITPAIIYELRKYKIPIIQTIHDYQLICPNHMLYRPEQGVICEKCISGSYFNCAKYKCIHGSFSRSLIAAAESYYYHTRNTYRLIDQFTTFCEFTKGKLQQGGITDKTIQVLYLKNTNGTLGNRNNAEKYVLYFGRFSHEKGIKLLVEVCRELPDISFIYAGAGPLESLLSGVKNIKHVGFVRGEELSSLIRNAAFSLCPSEYYDNCPSSVFESQALGVPVIGSRCGGIPEAIEHEKSGLLFAPGDHEGLKAAIRKLWEDDALRSAMREYCLDKPIVSIEMYTEQIVDIYNSLKDKLF